MFLSATIVRGMFKKFSDCLQNNWQAFGFRRRIFTKTERFWKKTFVLKSETPLQEFFNLWGRTFDTHTKKNTRSHEKRVRKWLNFLKIETFFKNVDFLITTPGKIWRLCNFYRETEKSDETLPKKNKNLFLITDFCG